MDVSGKYNEFCGKVEHGDIDDIVNAYNTYCENSGDVEGMLYETDESEPVSEGWYRRLRNGKRFYIEDVREYIESEFDESDYEGFAAILAD